MGRKRNTAFQSSVVNPDWIIVSSNYFSGESEAWEDSPNWTDEVTVKHPITQHAAFPQDRPPHAALPME